LEATTRSCRLCWRDQEPAFPASH